jgi:hypothetical protein
MTATLGTDCGCGCGGLAANCTSQTAAGERTRYYPRQLVAAADLTQDQLYFREKSRRHNRLLHGWGIVCGAEVRVSQQAGCVDVNAGYILGPYGDEIVIDDVVTVDLSARNADGDAANGCIPPDPWCAEVKVAPPANQPVYLAVAYAEYPCVPVQTVTSGCGCGCDETACEYSRWRDSYRIRVLDTLPDTYPTPMNPPWVGIAFSCSSDWATTNANLARELMINQPALATNQPAPTSDTSAFCVCPKCSPCPTSPWVILADITVNGDQITIDCNSHRRYVASFRDYFYMCRTMTPLSRPQLANLFTSSALDQLRAHPDNIAGAVITQPANSLSVDVPANSPLANRLASMTVADVALMPRDTFVVNMVTGASAAQRAALADRAGQIWEKAVAAKQLADGL